MRIHFFAILGVILDERIRIRSHHNITFYARRVCQAMRLLRVLTTLEEIALIFGTGYLAH